ncbi:MAG: ABC transporter permease [Pseudothermotoga sp.]|nr:ABC transporter permease [Pseudothermotoga sp.]
MLSVATAQAKILVRRNLYRFSVFVVPVFFSTLLYLVYPKEEHAVLAYYIVFGSGIASLWSVSCFSSSIELELERIYGTMEAVTITPAGLELVLISKIMANTTLGSISFAVVVAYSYFVLKLEFAISNPVMFACSFLILVLSFISTSFVFATLLTLSKNAFSWMSTIQYPVYFISGMLFPIDILPKWIRVISNFLPISWSVTLMRDSFEVGSAGKDLIFNALLLTLFYFLLGHVLFKKIERKSRAEGELV